MKTDTNMAYHEYANLFPMLGYKELEDLASDITTNGQQVPITLYEGKILDGRNRYQACAMAGIHPVMEEFDGDDALAFVVSHNLKRRHLTESQRGMVAAKLAKLKQGAPAGNRNASKSTPSIDGVESKTKAPKKKDREQAAKNST